MLKDASAKKNESSTYEKKLRVIKFARSYGFGSVISLLRSIARRSHREDLTKDRFSGDEDVVA